jgi:hypothetical protein
MRVENLGKHINMPLVALYHEIPKKTKVHPTARLKRLSAVLCLKRLAFRKENMLIPKNMVVPRTRHEKHEGLWTVTISSFIMLGIINSLQTFKHQKIQRKVFQ